jgi:5-formyltetrahydrofolate cyclo-ligase
MSSSSLPDSLVHMKSKLRDEAFARRDGLDPIWRAQASLAMAEHALTLPELQDVEPISAFWPILSEIDVKILLEALHARGQKLCLPVVSKPAMIFRTWKPGDALVKSRFGVHEPVADAEQVSPRAMLVPLAAFDRQGGRIGYGKGHFDTAIAALEAKHPVLTVGVAFSVQEVASVPMEPHDRRIDIIVTETAIIRTSHSA